MISSIHVKDKVIVLDKADFILFIYFLGYIQKVYYIPKI